MASKKAPRIDIGIGDKDRAAIAKGLSAFLADSYTLYLMTHNYHWNVTGPMFNTLHLMFMGQYTEQWNALDLIAERIRSLGHPAPGTDRVDAQEPARRVGRRPLSATRPGRSPRPGRWHGGCSRSGFPRSR